MDVSRNAQAFSDQAAFGQVIATMSASFINVTTTNIGEVIMQVLSEIGRFCETDRSYVALFFEEDTTVNNIYEWCAMGVPSGVEGRLEVLPSTYPWLMDQMEKVGPVCIPRISDLPVAASVEKASLQGLGVQSMLNVPLILSGRLLGFLGLESIKQEKEWPKEKIAWLEIISGLFISSIERYRTEAAIWRVGVQNKAFLDSIPDIIFQVNRLGIIKGFKPSKQYPLAFSSDEVLGRHIKAILPLQAAPAVTDSITMTLDTGETQLFEYNLTYDNKTMHFETRVTKSGEEEVMIIVRNISQQWQSEACDLSLTDIAERVQEERPLDEIIGTAYEQIREIFGVRLLWVGLKEPDNLVRVFVSGMESGEYPQGTMLRWNELLESQGLTGTAIRTGKFQLMNIEDPRLHPWREILNKYSIVSGASFPLKVGGLILGSLTFYTDDREFWTKRTIVHLTNFARQIALAIHVTTNRQRLKLLTTGLESVANGIVITRRNGDIQWVNPAFLQLNGYGAAEVMRSNAGILGSGQYPRTFYKAVRLHILKGKIWQGELVNRRKDGSQYTSETTITPVRNEIGEITNFISIIQDITERKQAEIEMVEAREAIARAERLNALGTMAAGIAHEINQPLNSLKVMADGMLYWYKQGTVPEISDAMDNIQEISKQAERIDAIIKHMRSFIYDSQLDRLVPCDINRAVTESLLLIGSQLLSHDVKVKTDLAVDLPPIMGNNTQLEQVIINLLVNAMQTLDTVDRPDKQITIVTGREKGRAFLTISDNGAGISKELKSKIFDPFFTTKFAGEGMGLGLSIVHSIVTAYGGQIQVKDNKQAGGVTFRIGFPFINRARKKAK